jgi:catechol 2,3-dioxygenase-like lactoylglutathione lyase family enzyme
VLWLARCDAKSHDPERRASRAGDILGRGQMQQQISVVTLGIADLARSRRFYVEGFGWKPVFENPEIVFYQMNGLMLGTWLAKALEEDMRRTTVRPGTFALAHNVKTKDEVQPVIDRLAQFGGKVLRPADAPPHGGFRGYIADPDDHAWEIAWNPAWPISPEGYVTWGT